MENLIKYILGALLVIFTAWLVFTAECQRQDVQEATREQRAFVQVLDPVLLQDTTFADTASGLPRMRVKFQLQNAGQTTANDVRDASELRIIDATKIQELRDPRFMQTTAPPRVLGGGVKITLFGEASGNRRSLVGYDPGRESLFFYGVVRYKDIYGKRRWTTFCYQYIHLHRAFSAYEEFNDADRD